MKYFVILDVADPLGLGPVTALSAELHPLPCPYSSPDLDDLGDNMDSGSPELAMPSGQTRRESNSTDGLSCIFDDDDDFTAPNGIMNALESQESSNSGSLESNTCVEDQSSSSKHEDDADDLSSWPVEVDLPDLKKPVRAVEKKRRLEQEEDSYQVSASQPVFESRQFVPKQRWKEGSSHGNLYNKRSQKRASGEAVRPSFLTCEARSPNPMDFALQPSTSRGWLPGSKSRAGWSPEKSESEDIIPPRANSKAWSPEKGSVDICSQPVQGRYARQCPRSGRLAMLMERLKQDRLQQEPWTPTEGQEGLSEEMESSQETPSGQQQSGAGRRLFLDSPVGDSNEKYIQRLVKENGK